MSKKLTANNLKNVLWETLQAVRAGEIPPNQADAIARQAGEITRVNKLQHDVSQSCGDAPPDDLKKFVKG
jgi:hypothetical protein